MRVRLPLDGEWEFAPDPDRRLDPAALAGAERRQIGRASCRERV